LPCFQHSVLLFSHQSLRGKIRNWIIQPSVPYPAPHEDLTISIYPSSEDFSGPLPIAFWPWYKIDTSSLFYLELKSPNFTARSVSTLQQLSTALLQIFLRTNTKNKTKVDVVCNRRFIQQKSVPRVALLSFVGTQKVWSIRRAAKEEHKLYLLAHIHCYFLS